MPFRSKLKKAFGRSESTSESPSTGGGTNSAVSNAIAKKDKSAKKHRWNQKTTEWDNWPEHLYKPYEVPEPKYKRPPAKEHTKKLEKFTWDTDAHADDRRPSATSQYSPMGSRLHSRRSSGLGPDGEELGPGGELGGPIDGVDPADDGGPLAQAETVRLTPASAAAAAEPPKVSAGAAEPNMADAFDSSDLTRALTAIKDGHSTAVVGA
jgi:hypothetical protein